MFGLLISLGLILIITSRLLRDLAGQQRPSLRSRASAHLQTWRSKYHSAPPGLFTLLLGLAGTWVKCIRRAGCGRQRQPRMPNRGGTSSLDMGE